MLNQARKKVEGIKRNVPFSQEKLRKIETIGFWKMKVRQLKEENVDDELTNRKKERGSVEVQNQISLNEAKNG